MKILVAALALLWAVPAWAEDWVGMAADLIEAEDSVFHCLGWHDLKGGESYVSLRVGDGACYNDLTKPKEPAFFLVQTKGRGNRDLWVFLKRDGALVPVLTAMLSNDRIRPINSIRLKPVEGYEHLMIRFTQTILPLPGDRPFRPGPPQTSRFVFDGKAYVRYSGD